MRILLIPNYSQIMLTVLKNPAFYFATFFPSAAICAHILRYKSPASTQNLMHE